MIVHEKVFKFHGQPQTGAYSCSSTSDVWDEWSVSSPLTITLFQHKEVTSQLADRFISMATGIWIGYRLHEPTGRSMQESTIMIDEYVMFGLLRVKSVLLQLATYKFVMHVSS